ncbi:MAG: phage tail sheath subtilisin-like domain-containing protein [Deltaproteobacteria bacterium]|nr:phage tail sheath subtilisin-like domain-containing protein [Deltaproteobacteria bacterium]
MQEISTLPGVVVEVASAVPAFIGYTEKTHYDGRDLTGVPEPVASFKDFETRFGREAPIDLEAVEIRTDASGRFQNVEAVHFKRRFLLYQAVYTYFKNGGDSCFVVSIGAYKNIAVDSTDKDDFLHALKSLEVIDDVTLLVMPEAVFLGDSLPSVQQAALAQCAKQHNRFAILDIAETTNGKNTLLHWNHSPNMDAWKKNCQDFRDHIGSMNLSYGAAYTPYILTDVKAGVRYEHFRHCLVKAGMSVDTPENLLTLHILDPAAASSIASLETALHDLFCLQKAIDKFNSLTAEAFKSLTESSESSEKNNNTLSAAMRRYIEDHKKILSISTPDAALQSPEKQKEVYEFIENGISLNIQRLSDGLESSSAVYRAIASAVQGAVQVQPPSAAIAGIYANVDRQRGVWKAPANVSLSNVKGLSQTITVTMQESLNSDPVAGKSINALRSFPGQGVLVWGARTLDGNSLEWRYIPVRRFFLTIEESIRRATSWTVVEPNDATLWVKLKAMIDNYLLQKWKEGALAGASPAEAFYVAVGLGSTMTEQDILEGRLFIDIGMAVVRPAEFIVLRFAHKMQQS